jgi:ribosomal protein L21
MFAVIKTGGKQYRVAVDDKIEVEKVAGERGDIVEFGEVLMVGGDSVTVGTPAVAGASVAAEVLNQGRGPKVIAFKKRRRKNSRGRSSRWSGSPKFSRAARNPPGPRSLPPRRLRHSRRPPGMLPIVTIGR